jgi:hypothetical protein
MITNICVNFCHYKISEDLARAQLANFCHKTPEEIDQIISLWKLAQKYL